MINGSPHEAGCTYTALSEIAGALGLYGIENEIWQLGKAPRAGCTACGACFMTRDKCVLDDGANELIGKINAADGLVIGSPVYYASANGILCALLDRVFFAKKSFAGKPACAVVSCRRGGSTAAFDGLNKYFSISEMPIVTSCYWNGVHGINPDDVKKDEEGMQVMRTLGKNMAWMLRCIEAGKAAGIEYPAPEAKKMTNFIR